MYKTSNTELQNSDNYTRSGLTIERILTLSLYISRHWKQNHLFLNHDAEPSRDTTVFELNCDHNTNYQTLLGITGNKENRYKFLFIFIHFFTVIILIENQHKYSWEYGSRVVC